MNRRPTEPGQHRGHEPDQQAADHDRGEGARGHNLGHRHPRVQPEHGHEHVEAQVLQELPGRLGVGAAEGRVAGAQRAQADPHQQQANRRPQRQLDVAHRHRDRAQQGAQGQTQSQRHDVGGDARPNHLAALALEDLDAPAAAGDAQDVTLLGHRLGAEGDGLSAPEHGVEVQAVADVRARSISLRPPASFRCTTTSTVSNPTSRAPGMATSGPMRGPAASTGNRSEQGDRVLPLQDGVVPGLDDRTAAGDPLDRDHRILPPQLPQRPAQQRRRLDLVGAHGDRGQAGVSEEFAAGPGQRLAAALDCRLVLPGGGGGSGPACPAASSPG